MIVFLTASFATIRNFFLSEFFSCERRIEGNESLKKILELSSEKQLQKRSGQLFFKDTCFKKKYSSNTCVALDSIESKYRKNISSRINKMFPETMESWAANSKILATVCDAIIYQAGIGPKTSE